MSKDGGPAFPSERLHDPRWGEIGAIEPGMSLRDYFAAMAMQGAIAHGLTVTATLCAQDSYAIADAMLAERAK